jgi:hypothetical protein
MRPPKTLHKILPSIFVFLFVPLFAFAAITNICGIVKVVDSISKWFGIVVFIVSVMAFLYAALLFLTNSGDTEKLTTARQVLVYAVIGTVIALLATNAVTIIKATIGGDVYTVANCSSYFP